MFRFRSTLTALSTALCLALFAEPAAPGECSGVARRVYIFPHVVWVLICTPHDCPEGCGQVQVATPNGPGRMCQCNYVGPHPNCCSLVVLNNGDLSWTGGLTTVGVCGDPGCPPESGACQVRVAVGAPGSGGMPYEAACVPAPELP